MDVKKINKQTSLINKEENKKKLEMEIDKLPEDIGFFELGKKLSNKAPMGLKYHKLYFNIKGDLNETKEYEIVFLFKTETERNSVLSFLGQNKKVIDGEKLKKAIKYKNILGDYNE